MFRIMFVKADLPKIKIGESNEKTSMRTARVGVRVRLHRL